MTNKKAKNINDKDNENILKDNSNNVEIKNIYKFLEKYSDELKINNSNILLEDNLENILNQVTNINLLKEQLSRLQLSPEAKIYYEMEIIPIMTLFQSLSTTSYNFSFSASSISNISSGKNSKLKDALHLVYDINETAEDVFKLLKNKIKVLLSISEEA